MAKMTRRAMYLNIDMGYVLTYPEMIEDAKRLYGFTMETSMAEIMRYYEIVKQF